MNDAVERVWVPLSECLVTWDLSTHDLMLDDRARMDAYRRAIVETVRPGDVVVDLGTGTGILAQWALEAGAARVTGIEINPAVLAVAGERLRSAGHGERFVPLNTLSYHAELDEPADVLVSELIGNLADNENFQPILSDAIARLLKPGGRTIPLAVSSFLVPVAARRAHDQIVAGDIADASPGSGLDYLRERRGLGSLFDIYYDCIIPSDRQLAAPERIRRYEGLWQQAATYTERRTFRIGRPGLFTGFKGFFIAELSATVDLDISGGDDALNSWRHAFLPIRTPVEVVPDDRITVSFSRSYPADARDDFHQAYAWWGSIERGEATIARFAQGNPPVDAGR